MCHHPEPGTRNSVDWRLMVEERIAKISMVLLEALDSFFVLSNYFFGFWVNKLVLQEKKYLSWQTSLLCIVMELAEGGSLVVAKDVAVALGFIGFVVMSALRDSVA